MSGTGHKDSSKFAAHAERCARMRAQAVEQRAWARQRRERLRSLRESWASPVLPSDAAGHAMAPGAAMSAVALAASAGGVVPLLAAVAALPANFGAAVIVAHHTGPRSVLPHLLQSSCVLPVISPRNGEIVR